jgi:hypothetical protein
MLIDPTVLFAKPALLSYCFVFPNATTKNSGSSAQKYSLAENNSPVQNMKTFHPSAYDKQ